MAQMAATAPSSDTIARHTVPRTAGTHFPARRKGYIMFCGNGNGSCLWIIIILILLFCCGGCGSNMGGCGCGCAYNNGCGTGCNTGCSC